MTEIEARTTLRLFGERRTADLAHLSLRQLRSWARSDFYRPAVDARAGPSFPVSLYDYRDVICLRIIGLLRNDHQIPFDELRKVKTRLLLLGPECWRKTTLYVLRRSVMFDCPNKSSREVGFVRQKVLAISLQPVMADVENEVETLSRRDPKTIGKIERKRGLANGRPVIAGTRVLVETVAAFLEEGILPPAIMRDFPILTAKDIAAVELFKETL